MIVIVYGYEGSGEQHWQRWLLRQLQARGIAATLPELPEPLAPDKDTWVAELARLVESSPTPVTLICHSLGCWAVDHLLAKRGTHNIARALLVAPPSPFLIFEAVDTFLPPPCRADAWAPIAARSLLVSGDNDEFSGDGELQEIAIQLGLGFKLVPDAGHINTASGYGPWPFALEWATAIRESGVES